MLRGEQGGTGDEALMWLVRTVEQLCATCAHAIVARR